MLALRYFRLENIQCSGTKVREDRDTDTQLCSRRWVQYTQSEGSEHAVSSVNISTESSQRVLRESGRAGGDA